MCDSEASEASLQINEVGSATWVWAGDGTATTLSRPTAFTWAMSPHAFRRPTRWRAHLTQLQRLATDGDPSENVGFVSAVRLMFA